ncbi:MAG: hypothetical protein IT429_22470 [Gemmataceae bacterium]|nr:hypothetical protein [Gemmataceae bacterium]
MVRPRLLVLAPVLLLTGCLPLQLLDPTPANSGMALVPNSPFAAPAPEAVVGKASFAPGAGNVAVQVDQLGSTILAKNPTIGARPLFALIGAPHPEIFHQGTQVIHVTEGLVKRCKTEGELAAVLCVELGKMVAEREATAGTRPRAPQRQAPLGVAMGNAGQVGASDPVALAELARYEKARKEAARTATPPDPHALAARYLEKAGYDRGLLDTVTPLLAEVEKNYVLEKQFRRGAGAPGWVPVSAK